MAMAKSVVFLCNDHTLCESVTLYLSAWYPASCARSFKDLAAHMRKHGSDLLLIDAPLCEELVEGIKRIKKSHAQVSIIVMAVYQPATARFEAQLRPSADVWFHKPFDLEELRKSVERLLGPVSKTN